MSMRKRSMSIFTEPVKHDEDGTASSDDDDDNIAVSGAKPLAITNGETSNWTLEEKRTLLQAIEEQLPEEDTISYTRRLKTLKWETICINGREEQDCKLQLMVLLKKIRHVRSLRELFGDVHQKLDNPRETKKSAYSLFCADFHRDRPQVTGPTNGRRLFTDMAEAFRNLAPEERQRYDAEAAASTSRSKKTGMTAERKLAELLAELEKQPGTPFNMFCRDEVAQGRYGKMQMRSDYAQLTDEQRIVYVRRAAVEAQAKAVDPITVLTTKEFKLLKTGGEAKKTITAYNLFVRQFYQDNANASFHDVSKAYRELAADQKVDLKAKVARLKEAGKSKKDTKTELSSTSSSPKKLVQTSLHFATPPPKKAVVTTTSKVDLDLVDGTSSKATDNARKRKSNGNVNIDDTIGGDESIQVASPIGNSTRNIKQECNSGSENGSARKQKRIKSEAKRPTEPERVPA